MRVVIATGYAHRRSAERDIPLSVEYLAKPRLAHYLVAHQYFAVLVAIQRPCDQLDDPVESRQELSVGDVLDGNVDDQNSPVEVLAHVCLDRRHDVRDTKAPGDFRVHGQ